MGPQMFRFGKEWNPIPELRHSARVPALELAGATGASVAICVLHQGQTMAVGTIPGKTEQILPIERGQVWPWTTAAGRLLTAGMPPDVPLGPLPGSWRREAAAILDRGVCIDHEEIVPGVVCIAVPLHDPANRMTAALTALTAPTRRLPQLIDVVRRVGKTVSASARPRR
jgi:DNA-binding IclR family transcriptional regulator